MKHFDKKSTNPNMIYKAGHDLNKWRNSTFRGIYCYIRGDIITDEIKPGVYCDNRHNDSIILIDEDFNYYSCVEDDDIPFPETTLHRLLKEGLTVKEAMSMIEL